MIPRLFVPDRRVQHVLAWIAFWPLAWAATTDAVYTIVLVAASFFGLLAVSSRTTKTKSALDAEPRSAPAFALWMGLCALLVAISSQHAHRHGLFAYTGPIVAALGVMLAGSAVVAWLRLGRWVDRVYRGDIARLRVRATHEQVDAPLLSKIEDANAAIVEGASHDAGPYRAGEGRVVARVPADARMLRRRLARRAFASAFSLVVCFASLVVALPTVASRAHDRDLASTPATLPPLPSRCRDHRITLRFVALAPLRVVDIDEVASRYAATGIGEVVTDEPLPFDDDYLDRTRGQIIGEAIARAARKRYRPRENELVVVVTDRDMFLREVDWRFAFATREAGISIVSIARMDPNFPLVDPHAYTPARAACSATVRARAFRMITRQVLLGLCSAETVEDPRSARRRTVMGLSDLDAIDEATY